MTEAQTLNVATARNWLADGEEIAFLDLREEGPHCDGHPLLAVNLPYSRLELDILRLVPRQSTRVVLVDDDDGVVQHFFAVPYASESVRLGLRHHRGQDQHNCFH